MAPRRRVVYLAISEQETETLTALSVWKRACEPSIAGSYAAGRLNRKETTGQVSGGHCHQPPGARSLRQDDGWVGRHTASSTQVSARSYSVSPDREALGGEIRQAFRQ